VYVPARKIQRVFCLVSALRVDVHEVPVIAAFAFAADDPSCEPAPDGE
jgi:hypothetical protein